MIEIPVLIVGGGPVGLTASILLSQHGVRSLLVERHPGTAILPKARGINARTMEMYRQIGIETGDPRSRPRAGADRLYRLDREPRRAARSSAASRAAWRRPTAAASPVLNCLCAQDDLEPVLRRFAEAQAPAELRFNTEMIAVEQDAGRGHRHAHSIGSAAARRTSGRNYLIAADGVAEPGAPHRGPRDDRRANASMTASTSCSGPICGPG